MKKTTITGVFCIAFLLQPVFLMGQRTPSSQGFNSRDPSADMDRAFNSAENPPTLEDEYYLGRAVAANILANYKLYNQNIELTLYLNRILQSLVINSEKPQIFNGYHLVILDTQGYNAYATPGGHIFITKGLVEAASSEDQLAAIIAHELGHIILRHAASIIDDMRLNEEMASMAQQAAAFAGKGNEGAQRALAFRNSVTGVIDTMLKNGFSKSQEFEADKKAAAILAASGYNPGALVEILNILQKVQQSQAGGFNSTHPSPSERISNVTLEISRYKVTDTRPVRSSRFKNK